MRGRLKGRLKARLQRALPNSSRVYLDAFVGQAAASLPPGARILDAGAGSGLYRRHFEHVAYESADFGRLDTDYGDITYRCDLTDIPADDGRYDLVLCTQVLEHVPEPSLVLRELARVLKPGGALWLSAPLFYQEHQAPYDFYRYTQYGLGHLVEGAGFTVERLEWLEGYGGTLAYQLAEAAWALPVAPAAYGGGLPGLVGAAAALALKPVFYLAAHLFMRLDARAKHVASGQCKNYAVVARKARAP